jgi:glycosyltransferase involved in cell wall biosynthesis
MMAEAPRPIVTLGMPLYNEGGFLSQALDSILAQQFTNLELVIRDNASTDETAAICRAYAKKDPRMRYFRSERNEGAVSNFRRVLDMSAGKYFMWAAGHDLWDPSFISKCLAVLESDPSVVLAYSQIGIIDNRGNIVETIRQGIDTRGRDSFERLRWTIVGLHRIQVNDLIYGLIRSEALRPVVFRNVWGWDHLVSEELSLAGSFVQLDERLYFRRRESGRGRDLPAWTDEYLERLRPGNSRRRVQFTYSEYWWASCHLVIRAPFGRGRKWRLLIDLSRAILRKHWRGILFHDVVFAPLRLLIGRRAARGVKAWAYGVVDRLWPSRLEVPDHQPPSAKASEQ